MSYFLEAYPAWLETLAARDLRHLDATELSAIVERQADVLSNRCWSSMRMGWFDAVDEALAAAGSKTSLMNGLFNREVDVKNALGLRWHASTGVFMVGCALHSELDGLLASLDVPLQGEEGEAVEEVRGWLREAKRLGSDLLTFYT